MPVSHRQRAILLTTTGVNVAYTGLVPLVPLLQRDLHLKLSTLGAAFAVFALAKAVCQPVGGMLLRRWSDRAVASVALIGVAASVVGTASAHDAFTLLGARTAWGIAEGLMTPALYSLVLGVAVHDQVDRSVLLGRYGAFAVGGMALGPALLGPLAQVVSWRLVLVGLAVTVLFMALVLARAVPGARPTHQKQDRDKSRPNGHTLIVVVAVLAIADMTSNLLYASLEPLLPLTVTHEYGRSSAVVGVIFAAGLGLFALVSLVGGHVLRRLPTMTGLAAGLALSAIPFLGIAVASSLGMVIGLLLVSLGIQPVVYVLARRGIADACGQDGVAFGWFGCVSDLGFVVGPQLGTAIYAVSVNGVYVVLGVVGLFIAALLGIFAVVPSSASRAIRGMLPVPD